MPSPDEVLKALAKVTDPELGRDIVSLHMVEDVRVDGGKVSFTLNLTTPACPLRSRIEEGARNEVSRLPGVKEVAMKTSSNVFATRDYDQTEFLKGVKNIIAVASGKGGVGKSTIAVNLAAALAASGAKVGILDADVYGPNVPHMLGLKTTPTINENKLVPPVAFGVKVASLGFFYKDETPLIWRGPLVAGAIRQLLTDVEWGELDYLVVDLPPGCLPAGTLVSAANNAPKPIEQIKPGEFVLSYDGSGLVPRRVLGVVPQGKQEVFKLVTSNRTIIASANHPFLKYQWTNKLHWRRLDQLKPGDRIRVVNCIDGGAPLSLPRIEHDPRHITLPRVTNNDFMWLVGHFIGEGFVKKVKNRKGQAELRICEPKGAKFRTEYESLYRKVFNVATFSDNGGRKFAVSSAPLVELFQALDLVHSAKEKNVPDWVFSLPIDQRRSFIIGYAHADAHIRHRETEKAVHDAFGVARVVSLIQDTVSVASTNENLVRRLHELCIISGFRAGNVTSRIRKGSRLRTGRLIGPNRQFEFGFSLKPDYAKFKLARIRKIEPLGEMETYDLQVDEYQNFIANSMIVHNTGDASLTLAQTVPLGGVVIVSTPQEAALSIASKALGLFRKLNVPILGVVENMSYFVCPNCGERTYVFSTGGGRRIAAQLGVDFLGEIPLVTTVREQSDLGAPLVASKPESPEAAIFKDFAFRVAGMVSITAFSKMKQ